jgi:hypothetical protein
MGASKRLLGLGEVDCRGIGHWLYDRVRPRKNEQYGGQMIQFFLHAMLIRIAVSLRGLTLCDLHET